jgi:CubicO group peptidase (beta-lactamase class C family)
MRISIQNGSVAGTVAPGFEPVARAFAANFEQHAEVGAACAVYRDGRPVVDLWGGLADQASGRPWRRDTITVVFSAAKGPTATCIHQLAEAGRLDLDLPVAHYWPEFGCNGKERITTGMVLSHQGGLGYSLQPALAPGAGPRCFGHPGAGGALAFADPEAGLGFAYVMNAMRFEPDGDPRSLGLVRAAYQCLGAA